MSPDLPVPGSWLVSEVYAVAAVNRQQTDSTKCGLRRRRRSRRRPQRPWVYASLFFMAFCAHALLIGRWIFLGERLMEHSDAPLTILTIALNRMGQAVLARPLPALAGLALGYLLTHHVPRLAFRRLFCGVFYFLAILLGAVHSGFVIQLW